MVGRDSGESWGMKVHGGSSGNKDDCRVVCCRMPVKLSHTLRGTHVHVHREMYTRMFIEDCDSKKQLEITQISINGRMDNLAVVLQQ